MILFPKSYTVERRSATDQWVKGQLVPGTPVQVPFIGDVQPANSALVSLQIGRQGVGKVRVFSDRQLQVGSTSEPVAYGDIITVGGARYELIQENPFQGGIIPHYEYLAELREATA